MIVESEHDGPRRAPALGLLSAAPHRLLFFVGAGNVLLAMVWWTLWLGWARWPRWPMPQPSVLAGWMHAIVMQYQVLPPFMFGFLLTVFPFWLGVPALSRRHYVPVGLGLLGGQILTLVGLCGLKSFLFVGLLLTLAGWIVGLAWMIVLLVQAKHRRTWHAVSCVAALGLGLVGLLLTLGYLYSHDARLIIAAIKIGSFGLLLPVYFTVAHRMFPFFAGMVVKAYRPWQSLPLLAGFWLLCLLHLTLEIVPRVAWLWTVDLPLLAVSATWLWRNWPGWSSPALLRVLFLGFAWLPVAMGLYGVQSLWFATTGHFMLGRAPAHALFVGFFGSLLVAMVTRVTRGHSGRPLQLGRLAGVTFALMQLVAAIRIVADVTKDPLAWQVVAGVGWLLALLPWVLRSGWIYLSPRVDGKSG